MLCREINAVCNERHTKRINALRGHNVEFENVKPDGTNGFSLFSLFLRANNWVPHLSIIRSISTLYTRNRY